MGLRLLWMVLALGAVVPTGMAADDLRLAVIVHPERRVELSVEQIAQIYLRRKRFWPDGAAISPLNLSSGVPLRALFARRVLNLAEARLADYWNRQYFNGVLPPATLASTEAIRRYVAADRNAIGYVPASVVDASVRVVLYLE